MITDETLALAIKKAMKLNDCSRDFVEACRAAERYYGLPRFSVVREISKRRSDNAAENKVNKTAKIPFKKNK